VLEATIKKGGEVTNPMFNEKSLPREKQEETKLSIEEREREGGFGRIQGKSS